MTEDRLMSDGLTDDTHSRLSAHDEVELKAMVSDVAALEARLVAAGAVLVFAGTLRDRRYDTIDSALDGRDEALRLRVAAPHANAPGAAHASLDWKGPTRRVDGYKVREERSTAVGDAATAALILERAGFVVTRAVDRDIRQYTLRTADAGAVMLRVERYPHMDVLLEVEGAPSAIEVAIAATGLPRAAFTTASLVEMAAAFGRRTGTRARVAHDDPA